MRHINYKIRSTEQGINFCDNRLSNPTIKWHYCYRPHMWGNRRLFGHCNTKKNQFNGNRARSLPSMTTCLVAGEVWESCVPRGADVKTTGGRPIDSSATGRRWRIDRLRDWRALVASWSDEICRLRVWRFAVNLSHECRCIFEQANRQISNEWPVGAGQTGSYTHAILTNAWQTSRHGGECAVPFTVDYQ